MLSCHLYRPNNKFLQIVDSSYSYKQGGQKIGKTRFEVNKNHWGGPLCIWISRETLTYCTCIWRYISMYTYMYMKNHISTLGSFLLKLVLLLACPLFDYKIQQYRCIGHSCYLLVVHQKEKPSHLVSSFLMRKMWYTTTYSTYPHFSYKRASAGGHVQLEDVSQSETKHSYPHSLIIARRSLGLFHREKIFVAIILEQSESDRHLRQVFDSLLLSRVHRVCTGRVSMAVFFSGKKNGEEAIMEANQGPLPSSTGEGRMY